MKTETTKLLLFFSLFINSVLIAQEVTPGKEGMWPSSIKFNANQPVFKQSMIQLTDEKGERVALKDVKLQHKEKDELGFIHYRYQQEYNNIPVEHARWVVHTSNGRITSQNGKLIKSFPSGLITRATFKPKEALTKALEFFGAKQYKWESPAEEEFLRREQGNESATFYPKATLIYYSGEGDVNPATLRLAYKFDIYANDPVSRKFIFVDALNGEILGEREQIHETNVNGTAITVYSGSQSIRTDFTGATYRLQETARGTGNGVVNTFNLQKGTNYSGAVDFTDGDNTWNNVNANKDEYATDAHWATEKTYDYYFIKHSRNSIDNTGFPLNSYVHYSTNYFNAFWDGSRMTYGDGNSMDGFKPLTSLDVCGHEITHGVTEHTSNLDYSYESGAMNEGFSDIFGTAIEWYSRPTNADWLIGGDFYTIRSMSNPNAFSHPDTYLGSFWYTGSSDYGGVHTNSGVLNYWFYLLTTGGSGTNDHGVAYNVSGIGMEKAARIAYRLNSYYLISTSNYSDARVLGIQAAEEIFGYNSFEAVQTANAWTAVGLYAPTCGNVVNLTSSSITEYSANLSWDAMPGAVYYIIEYKPQTSSIWTSGGAAFTTNKTITGLTMSTVYDWRVKSSCSVTFSQAQFTSASPACNAPSGLGATIVGNTVTLEWNPVNYGVSYHIEFKPIAATDWIDSGWVTSSSFTLTGLNHNTVYNWRIETNCNFDTSGSIASTFLTDAPSCGTPTGLSVSYSAGPTTTLRWDVVPGAIQYRVQFKWPYSSWGSADFDTTVTNDTLNVIGFGSGMNLDWRIRAECADNLSLWTQSTLSTPCPAPTGLTVSTVTSNSATLNWIASGANTFFGYSVYFKLSTSATWIYSGATTGTTYSLSGLAAGKLYDVKVRQACLNYNSTEIQSQFTTLCANVPAALTATSIKTNGANISWNAVSGAVTYTLQYKKSSVSTWTTISGITVNFYSLTGLTASTIYNYRVNAVCTYGSSAYSPTASFNTYCNSSGNNNQEWIDYFSLGAMARGSWSEPGGYVHTGLSANLVIGSTGNAGLISAGFNGSTRTEIYAIYIDLNQNGVYTDAGERVAGPTTFSTSGNVSFTLAIPVTASPGLTSMRVVMLRNGSATMAPCLTGNRGETEDYFVNLTTTALVAARVSEETPLNDQVSESLYQVNPNPSEGKYKVESINSNAAQYYEIVNLSGAIIEKRFVKSDEEITIDITNQAAGIYFLRIRDVVKNIQVLKLVKK